MDIHKKKLAALCRFCGVNIVLKQGYVTPKPCSNYKDILLDTYGILQDEDPKVRASNFV